MSLLKILNNQMCQKIKENLANVLKNSKVEIIIIVILLLSLILSEFNETLHSFITIINEDLVLYMTEYRMSLIVSASAIFIGAYVTVWSIMATSISKMNREILSRRLDQQIFVMILVSIVCTFILIIFIIFIPTGFNFYHSIVLTFTMIAFISFVKFISFVMKITKISTTYTVKELTDNENKEIMINTKIDYIYEKLKKKIDK